MKTVEQLTTHKGEAIDGRDTSRLVAFIPEDKLAGMGLALKDDFVGKHQVTELTRDAVLVHLKEDVAFGFEKALDKRGISASCMNSVVKMWLWVLEEGLEDFDEYAQYGLPLLKAVALKYGFDNPIGDDAGNEDKYSSEG